MNTFEALVIDKLKLAKARCDITVTGHAAGMVLPDDLSFEEWREIGAVLLAYHESKPREPDMSNVQWCIGDWLNFGVNTFDRALVDRFAADA